MKQPGSVSKKRQFFQGAVLAVVVVTGGRYLAGDKSVLASVPAPAGAPVMVQTLAPQKMRVWSEFSGRLQAVNSAEIRPEVSGRITELRFEDGQEVRSGDILFVIDPRPYEAAVAKAEAALATAKTNANFAKLEEHRAADMLKTEAIARRLYDERANASRVAVASVQSAAAELKNAQVDLEHAYVRAPIRGRVGRAELTVGNNVNAGPAAPLLTTVVSSRSIYADFEVDEQTYLQNIRNTAGGRDKERTIPVELTAKDDASHVYKGRISSFDNQLNTGSGTIRARAKFSNDDGALVPGMFVSVRLANADDSDALMVPDRALGFDQDKKFVFVVGPDNKVQYREVELGKEVDGQRIVLKGVAAGDRVIVDGVQHVRPDAVVEPKEVAAAEPVAPTAPAEAAHP